jgi:hypothetical protein
MIKIIHCDYTDMFNSAVSNELKTKFQNIKILNINLLIHYLISIKIIELTEALKKSNIFLVHPGSENQASVIGYVRNFKNLQTILLVPETKFYRSHENITIFGWEDTKEVVNYVIGLNKK